MRTESGLHASNLKVGEGEELAGKGRQERGADVEMKRGEPVRLRVVRVPLRPKAEVSVMDGLTSVPLSKR